MNYPRTFRNLAGLVSFLLIVICPLSLYAQEEEAIEHESGFYYTIRKGDTLWDLSQKFSDSPWQWPDLWRENSQISNPHLIYPGERIRLYRKKDLETIVTPKKVVPPPVKAPEKEPPYFLYSRIDSVGFLTRKPIQAAGKIFKSRDEKEVISRGDEVYVQMAQNGGTMSPGERYTVYRKIRTADKEELFKRYGTQYYLVGVVELTRQQKNFMLATVVHSFREMRIGDLLIPYEPRSPKIVISSPPKNIQGSIVLGEEHQSIIGTNHVVFVDKGLKNGVRPGQAYSVFLQETGKTDPKSNKEILLLPVVYASLMVLHAEETTATCVVTKALKNISPGATWGTVEP